MTMHTVAMEPATHPVLFQKIDGKYVKRIQTKEERADMPVLRMVTGFTCDHCGSTNVEETGLRKARDGQWVVTRCGDCNVTVSYQVE